MPDEQAASRYWATAARWPFQDVFDALRIDFGSDLKAGVHSAPFWKTAGQGPALTSPCAIDTHSAKHIMQINQGGAVFLRVVYPAEGG